MTSVLLPRAIYDEIVAHAREGKPEEVCGVLRGRGAEAYALFRGRNVATDRVENYDVDPQTLLKQFEFEDAGDAMMGIYHSHPVSEAYPSATDAWNAHYPDAYYLICSLEHDEAPVIRAFKMLPHFPQLKIESLRREVPFQEVRPGLFGHYQNREVPAPAPLTALAAAIAPPFYIVFRVEETGAIDDCRVVQIEEHPVQVR